MEVEDAKPDVTGVGNKEKTDQMEEIHTKRGYSTVI